jgi:hypothetical protein
LKTATGNYAKLQFMDKDFESQAGGQAIIKYHYVEDAEF